MTLAPRPSLKAVWVIRLTHVNKRIDGIFFHAKCCKTLQNLHMKSGGESCWCCYQWAANLIVFLYRKLYHDTVYVSCKDVLLWFRVLFFSCTLTLLSGVVCFACSILHVYSFTRQHALSSALSRLNITQICSIEGQDFILCSLLQIILHWHNCLLVISHC